MQTEEEVAGLLWDESKQGGVSFETRERRCVVARAIVALFSEQKERKMIDRSDVYAAIDSERDYQDRKWGDTLSSDRPGQGERSIDEFATYIVGYAHKLLDIASTFGEPGQKLDAVRKVAGLCVACMEQHGAPRR